jgi:polyisoprenoid-binding protein YceI
LIPLCALLACGGHAAAAEREATTLTFDPTHSYAEFGVRVMWLIPIHGRFDRVRGTIVVDRFRGTARVEATLDVNEVHMRSRGDENWVKSAEFFDAQHYPEIYFASDAFSLERLKKGGEVSGELTIRGVKKPVKFRIEASQCPEAVACDCPAEAAGTIKRSEFGMRSRRGALSDKVDLEFSIHVQPPPATP